MHSEVLDAELHWHRKILAWTDGIAFERILMTIAIVALLVCIGTLVILSYKLVTVGCIECPESQPAISISRCVHQSCMERTVEVEGERCSCAHKLTGVRFTFEPEEAEED